MRSAQDILFDVTGQTLYFDAPEGRPSSVISVEIFPWDSSDDAGSEWTATGSVETNPNTTLDGAASALARSIPLTATTGIAQDRTYLLTHATTGLKEWVEVASITSGDSVTVKHPLHNDYASGATFQSTRIHATVDATWVADSSNLRDDAGPNPHYRVRWVYVVNSVTYVADTYFNLVRYAGQHGVRPQSVDSLAPGWLDSLPSDYRESQGRPLIDDAYRAVKMDLHAIWTDDAMVANTEVIDELTRYKTVELAEFGKILAGNGDTTSYQVARDQYQRRFDSLSRITNKAPIRDTSGAAQERPAIGLSRR